MLWEIRFTEIYFEDGEYFKRRLSIIVEGLSELFQAMGDFARLGIVNWTATSISASGLYAYQRACRKARVPIVLERKRKIDSDEAFRILYGKGEGR